MVSTSALSNLNSLAMVVFLGRADLPSSQARAGQVAASARAAAPPAPADSLVRGRHLVAARLQVAGPAALRGQLLPGRPSAPAWGSVHSCWAPRPRALVLRVWDERSGGQYQLVSAVRLPDVAGPRRAPSLAPKTSEAFRVLQWDEGRGGAGRETGQGAAAGADDLAPAAGCGHRGRGRAAVWPTPRGTGSVGPGPASACILRPGEWRVLAAGAGAGARAERSSAYRPRWARVQRDPHARRTLGMQEPGGVGAERAFPGRVAPGSQVSVCTWT